MKWHEILDIRVGSPQVSSAVCTEYRSIAPSRQNTDIYKPDRRFLTDGVYCYYTQHQIPQHNNLRTYKFF